MRSLRVIAVALSSGVVGAAVVTLVILWGFGTRIGFPVYVAIATGIGFLVVDLSHTMRRHKE
jgi:hypothetical protein